MRTTIVTLAAAMLVSGFATAQQQQQQQARPQQPEAIQNQPNPPQCWDTHTNQPRNVTAADAPATQPGSTIGSATQSPGQAQQNAPSSGTRPPGMANC
jgi:hypothetical protein